jgi:hypothetical protein
MELRILGPLEVAAGGEPVDLPSGKARPLLANGDHRGSALRVGGNPDPGQRRCGACRLPSLKPRHVRVWSGLGWL